jgi:hypothetical protein
VLATIRWQGTVLRELALPGGVWPDSSQLGNAGFTDHDQRALPLPGTLLADGGAVAVISYQAGANSFIALGKARISCVHLSADSATAAVALPIGATGDLATVIISYDPLQFTAQGGVPSEVEVRVTPGPGSHTLHFDVHETPPWEARAVILPI